MIPMTRSVRPGCHLASSDGSVSVTGCPLALKLKHVLVYLSCPPRPGQPSGVWRRACRATLSAMDGREPLAGRYELRGLLGRGGMAEVHDGWDTRLNRAVAIKLLHPTVSTDADARRRFE